MIISALKKKGNDVYVIFDDGQFLIIDYRIIVEKGLWKGQEISKEYNELLSLESSFVKAKDSAFRLLGMRLHSEHEIKLKLLKKKYKPDIINKVINHLTERKILNDLEFLRQYSAERIKKKKVGISKLTAELLNKGIKRDIIKAELSNLDAVNYFENALIIAEKKLLQVKQKETDSRKQKQKIFSFLSARGYETDIIFNVVQKLNIDKKD